MNGYTAIESAVIHRLIEYFPEELSESRVVSGDIDTMFDHIFSEGADYGCYLEFNGGREDTQKPYNKQVWIWHMVGIFLIRYGESIEARLRAITDRLPDIFEKDHRLGGATPYIRITEIASPDTGNVNDVPFYWLAFSIEAYDQ